MRLLRKLTSRLVSPHINHKFYYGQGGHLHLQLVNRNYNISFETIWEDYCLVDIDGLTGPKDYILAEDGNVATISDSQLDKNQQQVSISLKIPQDINIQSVLHGNLTHKKGDVPSKLRGNHLKFTMLKPNSLLRLTNYEAQKIDIVAASSAVEIDQLLAGDANIACMEFSSQKVSIAHRLDLVAFRRVGLRSLILQQSTARIDCNSAQIQSVMGRAILRCKQSATIKRLYGERDGIDIQSPSISVSVETGTGKIQGKGNIKLGRLHKGRLFQQSGGCIVQSDQ